MLQDGWGSYPDELQNCPVFQHAFQVGRRFYLAFQQHTSLQHAHQQANLFGAGQSFSLIRQLGHNVALVAPDVRAERTRKQVVSPESWQMVFSRMEALPSTVRHIVLLTTIPVVYPKASFRLCSPEQPFHIGLPINFLKLRTGKGIYRKM